MSRLTQRVRSHNPFAEPRTPTTVLPGVTLLGSQRINFYALTEGRSITLVDCGFFGHLRYLESWLAAEGRRLCDVEAVVITHGHADHLGFAAVLSERGVPVYVPEADLAVARTTAVRVPPARLRRSLWRPSCVRLLLEAACDSVFTQPPVTGAVGYAPGQSLDVPGRLFAVHVPGHSDGNCSLHLPDADAMFTGDTLMTRDPMLGGDAPLVFAEHPRRNAEAFASLERLQPFSSAALLPGHGEPWTEPDALGRALAQAVIA